VGAGLRYRTIVGPLRLDVGWRPPSLQLVGPGQGSDATTDVFGKKFQGAVNLTIGEPF
jgi:hypothetical protein